MNLKNSLFAVAITSVYIVSPMWHSQQGLPKDYVAAQQAHRAQNAVQSAELPQPPVKKDLFAQLLDAVDKNTAQAINRFAADNPTLILKNESDLACEAIWHAVRKSALTAIECLVEIYNIDVKNLKNKFDGRTILHIAATSNNVLTLENVWPYASTLLEVADNSGNTPLTLAIWMGNTNSVTWLIERNANIVHKDKIGKTILHLAALSDDVETMELIWQLASNLLEEVDSDGLTPLLTAVMHCKRKAIAWLIDKGASVEARNYFDQDICQIAVATLMDGLTEYIQNCCQNKVRRAEHQKHNAQQSAVLEFLRAVIKGDTALAQQLINKVDIISKDSKGCNILHWAAFSDNIDMLNFVWQHASCLLEHANIYGQTPLLYAVTMGTLGKYNAVKWLIEKGANINAQDDQGDTIVHIAAELNCIPMLEILLPYAPHLINSLNDDHYSPLALAIWKQHKEVARWLLLHGAQLTKIDLQLAYGKSYVFVDELCQWAEEYKFLQKQNARLSEILPKMFDSIFGRTIYSAANLAHVLGYIAIKNEQSLTDKSMTPLLSAIYNKDKIGALLLARNGALPTNEEYTLAQAYFGYQFARQLDSAYLEYKESLNRDSLLTQILPSMFDTLFGHRFSAANLALVLGYLATRNTK